MAVSNVALFGGAFLTPVIVGKMTRDIGWEWTFYLLAIFSAVAFPFIFFFVPETAFRRPDYLNTDYEGDSDRPHFGRVARQEATNTSESLPQISINGDEGVKEEENSTPSDGETPGAQETVLPQKVSYLQSLRLFNGRKTDEQFFKLFLRPLPLLFLHPGIIWVSNPLHEQCSRPLVNAAFADQL